MGVARINPLSNDQKLTLKAFKLSANSRQAALYNHFLSLQISLGAKYTFKFMRSLYTQSCVIKGFVLDLDRTDFELKIKFKSCLRCMYFTLSEKGLSKFIQI